MRLTLYLLQYCCTTAQLNTFCQIQICIVIIIIMIIFIIIIIIIITGGGIVMLVVVVLRSWNIVVLSQL